MWGGGLYNYQTNGNMISGHKLVEEVSLKPLVTMQQRRTGRGKPIVQDSQDTVKEYHLPKGCCHVAGGFLLTSI